MEVWVLGPLVARDDEGQAIHIGPKERVLLARLAAAVGRLVSDDVLTACLWVEPPPSARKTLHGYVHRLRTALGAEAIVREDAGYRIGDVRVDIDIVKRLVAEARIAAETERVDGSIERLREARAYFRGRPLPELDDDPTIGGIARQIEDLEFSIADELFEQELRVGNSSGIVAEIEDLVARDPTRERAWCQLATAFAQSGRQADALNVIARARRALAVELGIEPGPQMRRVEHAILEQRDLVSTSQSNVTRLPVPPGRLGNLPRERAALIGREPELDKLAPLLEPGSLVTLTGVGGIGKTRLALAAAHRASTDVFPDGIWLVELADVDPSVDIAPLLVTALSLRLPANQVNQAAIVESLQGQHRLIVLDNCEHVISAAARLADRILRRCAGVAILATSRQALGCEAERVMNVGPLRTDPDDVMSDAVHLFVDRAGRAVSNDTFTAGEVAVAGRICRLLDGHPLAVELAAARVNALGVSGVADALMESFEILSRPHADADRHQSLHAALWSSYDSLSDAERALFSRLCVFTGGFTSEAAREVCASRARSTNINGAIATLVEKSLLSPIPHSHPTRYMQLEPVRQFGQSQLADDHERLELWRRHLSFYAEWSQRAANGVRGPDEMHWHLQYTAEWSNLRTALKHAVELNEGLLACQLVCNVGLWAQERMYLESGEWAEAVLALPSAQDTPLSVVVAATACVVARIAGDHTRAEHLFQTAVDRAARLGSPPEPWLIHASSFQVLFGKKVSEDELLESLREQTRGDEYWMAVAEVFELILVTARLVNGSIEGEDAVTAMRRFVALRERAELIGNPTLIARAKAWHGAALRSTDSIAALQLIEEALEQSRLLGAERLVYQVNISLGPLYAAVGRPMDALTHLAPEVERCVRSGAIQQAVSNGVAALPALQQLGRPDLVLLALGHLTTKVTQEWLTYLLGVGSELAARRAVGAAEANRIVDEGRRLPDRDVALRFVEAINEILNSAPP